MKKKFILLTSLLIIGILIYDGSHNYIIPNATGAPGGYAGSPSDGGFTCAVGGCHGGTATTKTGWITSNIPTTGYVPGIVYTITATATYAGRSTFGFEISPQKAGGALGGTINITNTAQTHITATKYITHTFSGISGSGNKIWTFNWVAPPVGSGTITFYGAFNAANGDGTSFGDIIYTSTLAVSENTAVPVLTTTGTFAVFSTIVGSASSAQSFTVSGTNLIDTLTVSAPASFQVSANSSTGFGAKVKLSAVNGSVPPTTLYARYSPTVSGSASGNIAVSSTGAATKNIAVSGHTITTSINENELSQEVSILSNPSNRKLNILFNIIDPADITISLYSLNGGKVKEIGMGKQNAGNFNLEVPDLSSGLYILQVHIGTKIYTKKILIKNNA